MPYVLRSTTSPTLAEIAAIPQIVIIDRSGPSIRIGASPTAVLLVGEFLKGAYRPTEVTSDGQIQDLYGLVSPLFSQGASGSQDGGEVKFNGNGMLQLKGKKFKRLVMNRVDTEVVTSDGGATKGKLILSLVVATATDQTAGYTNKDIVVPAGSRFGNNSAELATTMAVLTQDLVIPKGSPVTGLNVSAGTNATPIVLTIGLHGLSTGDAVRIASVTGLTNANGSFLITVPTTTQISLDGTSGNGAYTTGGVVSPLAFAAEASLVKIPSDNAASVVPTNTINTVIDTAIPDVAAATVVSTVYQRTGFWAPGTGATLGARIDSCYAKAITQTLPVDSPCTDVKAIWAARRSTAIRALLKANAVAASAFASQGRVAIVSADPAVSSSASDAAACITAAAALSLTETLLSDRVIITFPHVKVFSSELGSVNVLVDATGFMASILSNFVSERSPGANPAPLLDTIVEPEDAFVENPPSKQDYINLLAGGVSPLQKDRTVGWWFVDGVTSVNPESYPTLVPIQRRMMADEIQAELCNIAAPYLKEPATTERVDAYTGELDMYLGGLLSLEDPSRQRIKSYSVDAVSRNTTALTDIGIYTILVYVKTLNSMRDIVYETQIGETVTIPVQQEE